MKPIYFVCQLAVLLLVRPCTLHARNNGTISFKIDSLNQRLLANPAPVERMGILFGLSDYWRDRDPRRALSYARECLNLAQQRQDNLYTGIAHFSMGNALNGLNELDKARAEYQYARNWLTPLKDKKAVYYLARIWNNIGIILQKRDSTEQQLDILLHTVVPLGEQIKDSILLANAYFNIAILLTASEHYEKARSYLDIAVRSYKAFLGPEVLAKCYLLYTKGALFMVPRELPFAEEHLKLARSILDQDTASRIWVMYYGMAGGCHYFRDHFPEALKSLDSGLALDKRWKVGYDALFLVWGKSETLYKLNRLPEAKQYVYLLDSLVDIYRMKVDRLEMLRGIAFIEGETGNYPVAYRKLKQYVEAADTASILKTNAAIAELEEKYQNEKKEGKIKELQSANRTSRYLTLLFVALIALLSLLLLLLRYRYRVRKRATEQQALALKQKIMQQEQEQQIAVTRALLEGEERERRRLAGDLHDGLGGMLATVRMNLSGLQLQVAESNRDLGKVLGQLDQSVSELRRIARNMMPESLLRSGLEAALTDLCDALPSDKIKAEYQMIGIPHVQPGQQEVLIYRIVQELLANVLRHADATEVFVQCSQSGHTFYITVEDNGRGFPDPDTSGKGIGMDNIRSRVDFLKGKMDIRTAPGKGTAVNIELHLS